MQGTRCFVNTKPLDGESNLKQVEAIRQVDNLFQDPSLGRDEVYKSLSSIKVTAGQPCGDL
jgi:hypothetical protein